MHVMMRQRGFAALIELAIYAAIIAGVTAAAWAAWSAFTGQYIERGRAEVRAKYALLIEECDKWKLDAALCRDAWLAAQRDAAQAQANFRSCQAAAAEQSKAVTDLGQRAEDAQRTTRALLAEIAKRADATRAEVDRLRKIAATPAASRKEACDEAESVLRAMAERRIRYAPTASDGGAGADIVIRPGR